MAGLITQIEWVRVQIDQREALASAGETAAGVPEGLKALDDTLIALEENLFQMRLTGRGQDMARWPARLISKLWGLAGEVSVVDFPPTTQQASRQREYATEVARHRQRLDEIVQQDLARMNEMLGGAGLPILHVVP